jgi:hypothetical protein
MDQLLSFYAAWDEAERRQEQEARNAQDSIDIAEQAAYLLPQEREERFQKGDGDTTDDEDVDMFQDQCRWEEEVKEEMLKESKKENDNLSKDEWEMLDTDKGNQGECHDYGVQTVKEIVDKTPAEEMPSDEFVARVHALLVDSMLKDAVKEHQKKQARGSVLGSTAKVKPMAPPVTIAAPKAMAPPHVKPAPLQPPLLHPPAGKGRPDGSLPPPEPAHPPKKSFAQPPCQQRPAPYPAQQRIRGKAGPAYEGRFYESGTGANIYFFLRLMFFCCNYHSCEF